MDMKFLLMVIVAVIVIAAVYFVNMALIKAPLFKSMEKVYFNTADGKKIAANLFPVKSPKGWLILAHMMPAIKESWNEFAEVMQEVGYESLAIDLRGHGESVGGPSAYLKFSDQEHQAGIKDLEASWDFLQSKGALPEKTTLIGASIGANLGLQFLTMRQDIGGGVFLSPGNYKGIDSGALIKKLEADQKLLLVASKKDERTVGNNAEQNQEYYNSAVQVKNRNLILFDGAGHGTELFALKEEFNLLEAIKKFLANGTIN